jgi:hypothetical protein
MILDIPDTRKMQCQRGSPWGTGTSKPCLGSPLRLLRSPEHSTYSSDCVLRLVSVAACTSNFFVFLSITNAPMQGNSLHESVFFYLSSR